MRDVEGVMGGAEGLWEVLEGSVSVRGVGERCWWDGVSERWW